MSFNVNLNQVLLEDAQCIPSLEKVDNTILLHHHSIALLFPFGP